MNDLQIVVDIKPSLITTNFDDIKSTLSEQMQVYKELEVTESNKPERKKDVATLRRIAKAVNDKKIEVKNEFLKPYEAFEQNVKELIEIINEPIGIIDNQVKEFEENQRLQKQEDIRSAFDSIITGYPTLADEIGLVVIYDNRWENATASMKSVKDEITAKLNTIRDNVTLISSMVSDKTEEALRLFWGDLDVAKAIQMINRYEAQKREIQARMEEQQRKDREAEEERQRLAKERELEREKQRVREEELERIRKEEQIRQEEQAKADAEKERIREEERLKVQADQEAKEQTEREAMSAKRQSSEAVNYIYGISASEEEFEQIEMYLNSLGVEFERIG